MHHKLAKNRGLLLYITVKHRYVLIQGLKKKKKNHWNPTSLYFPSSCFVFRLHLVVIGLLNAPPSHSPSIISSGKETVIPNSSWCYSHWTSLDHKMCHELIIISRAFEGQLSRVESHECPGTRGPWSLTGGT